MHTLFTLSYSPWSERARWALLHHRVSFRERAHLPLIGELALRVRARRFRGKVFVPLLVNPHGAVLGSLAIARYADANGEQNKLFPEHVRESIIALDEQVEQLLGAGRAHVMQTIEEHDDVARAMLPPLLQGLPFAAASARLGNRFVSRKFSVSTDALVKRHEEGLRLIKQTLNGRDYVHEKFTYADVLCATSLYFIKPVDDQFVVIDPTMRARWTQNEFVRSFPELFEWRDAIYAKHRPSARA